MFLNLFGSCVQFEFVIFVRKSISDGKLGARFRVLFFEKRETARGYSAIGLGNGSLYERAVGKSGSRHCSSAARRYANRTVSTPSLYFTRITGLLTLAFMTPRAASIRRAEKARAPARALSSVLLRRTTKRAELRRRK